MFRIQFLVVDNNYLNLDMTVKQALGSVSFVVFQLSPKCESNQGIYCMSFFLLIQKPRHVPICGLNDSLYTVFKKLVQTRKLRMVVIEPETRKVLGTISLSDIFNFLLSSSSSSSTTAKPGPDAASSSNGDSSSSQSSPNTNLVDSTADLASSISSLSVADVSG
jgi:hypothetical protein